MPKFDDDSDDDSEKQRVRIRNRKAVYKTVIKEANGKLSMSLSLQNHVLKQEFLFL